MPADLNQQSSCTEIGKNQFLSVLGKRNTLLRVPVSDSGLLFPCSIELA